MSFKASRPSERASQALFTLNEERSEELVSTAFEPTPTRARTSALPSIPDPPDSSDPFARSRGNRLDIGGSFQSPGSLSTDDDDDDAGPHTLERRRVSFNPSFGKKPGSVAPPRRAFSSQAGVNISSPRTSTKRPTMGARLESYRRSLSAASDASGDGGRISSGARASIRRSTTLDAAGTGTGNQSRFRGSRLLTDSIVRRSAALARFSRTSSSMHMDDSAATKEKPKKVYRGYVVGDPVLIRSEGDDWTIQVNKYGYPPGEGVLPEEQRGPYLYVLGKVKTLHFEEYSVYYTITREDTGEDVRGEAETMEPIHNPDGVEAARRAAQEFARDAGEEGDNSADMGEGTSGEKILILENIIIILLLPILWIYDCFVFVIGKRLFEWGSAIIRFLRGQAHLFLNGMKPYEMSATITTIDLIVICSTWYMFIDQLRLAFFPANSDYTLAVVNFVIWTILVLELIFEVFIRPDGYTELIVSDKAFAPTTVRYISHLHLVVESISLAFFIPEFVCLFSGKTCDGRPSFSFLNAAIIAVAGRDRLHSLAGRAFYACIRLRVFGLVRHWRNMWVHNTFLKKKLSQQTLGNRSSTNSVDDDDMMGAPGTGQSPMEAPNPSSETENNAITPGTKLDPKTMARLQKERDAALINASNIGTALMVTNSYRSLFILCASMGFFPMIALIFRRGVTNPVSRDMMEQLQATNRMAIIEDDATCKFLVNSVESWVDSWAPQNQRIVPERNADHHTNRNSFLMSLVIQPARCVDYFLALNDEKRSEALVPTFSISNTSCDDLVSDSYYDGLVGTGGSCILYSLDNNGQQQSHLDLRKVANTLDVRLGAIKHESAGPNVGPLGLADGTIVENLDFAVVANFNHSHSIKTSALCSFLLQLCLLLTVLVGLSVLRHDAESLVLAPLRSMLKIVARYAKNPLASAKSSEGGLSAEGSDSDSDVSNELGDGDRGKEADQFGNYETEQLITAVSKITDLLRKCWGVAGADIISTNLASREGALSEVFNPTVPGKSVYALFAFAAIKGFDHALKCLGGEVMILINDVAAVLHGEVFRWGFGDSGQCNKNLGAAFLMVFRIGLVKEVVEKLEEATNLVFTMAASKKLTTSSKKKKQKDSNVTSIAGSGSGWNTNSSSIKNSSGSQNGSGSNFARISSATRSNVINKSKKQSSVTDAMKLSLQSLPGISTFTDRAVIGMLKSFAGIHRDNKLRAWSRDFRLSAGVGTFSVDMIFGMDAGWAVEGAVGSEYKIDATYLSPHVNMASRMMSACKHYGVTILLSEAVQELMSDVARSKLRNLDRVTVKGSTRIQNIFTYDARQTGADFFLFSRSDEQADMEAERYMPSIWNTDQDLRSMRHHVTDDFEHEYLAGMKAYFDGDWKVAIARLEEANEIMVEAAMEEGYLHDELDNSPDRKELYRAETADGPSVYLVNFMKSQGGVAPDKWAGWHPLLSK